MTNEEAIKDLKTNVRKKFSQMPVSLDMAIKALQNEPRWVPCSERLPKENSRYLVTVNWRDEVYVDIDDYYCYGWDDYKDEVLAWCELPEPWRGEPNE